VGSITQLHTTGLLNIPNEFTKLLTDSELIFMSFQNTILKKYTNYYNQLQLTNYSKLKSNTTLKYTNLTPGSRFLPIANAVYQFRYGDKARLTKALWCVEN
jgi:hypothetical protein